MKPDASGRWFFAISSIVCLGLLWLVAGVWRSGGFEVFVGGTLALGGCLIAARFGWRRPLFGLYLGVLMAAFIVGTLEACLRLMPGVLNGGVANAAYGRYHTMRGGMYVPDPHLGFALKPNYSCDAYWQGHWWRHATNSAGYRGALRTQADAVFLGDSMIYGHGIEEEQTVSSQFADRTGWSVANLGQQGTGPIQMAIRLRRIGIELQPKVVFLCVHFNDIDDATTIYHPEELKRYAATDPAEPYEPTARRAFWPRHGRRTARRLWDRHMAPTLYLSGAIVGVQQAWSEGALCRRELRVPREHPFVPTAEFCAKPFDPSEADEIGWQATSRALARIDAMCRRTGARLVVFDIGYPHAFSQAIEDVAGRLGVAYNPAGRVALRRALAGEEVYLVNDGHWTAKGCQIVAAELARTVQE